MRRLMNINFRNTIIIASILLAVILTLTVVTYTTSRNIIEKTVSDQQQNIVVQASASTETWLNQQINVMESVLEEVQRGNGDILNVFRIAMRAGEFSDVYMGLSDGTMLDGAGWNPPSDYDPRLRPWYQYALTRKRISLTEPYIDMTTNKMVIAMASAVYKDDDLYGVVSADIILDSLVKDVLNVKVADKGHTFIVSENGTFLVHRDQNLLLKHRLQDMDPSLSNVMSDFAQSSRGTFRYSMGGNEYILAYHYISRVGWYLCTTMTLKEAYDLSVKTSMVSAAEAVVKILAILAVVTILVVVASAFILLINNKRFKTTVRQHQDVITGMNEDLEWNITRRKEVETHYQTLFHVANDAIIVSKGTIFIECNERAREMFHASKYGVIGDNMLDLSPLYQGDGKSSYVKLQKIIESAGIGEQQFFQWTFLRKDGKEFPAEVSLKNLHLNNEQLLLMSIRDISKRTTAEQQLRQAQKMAAMGEMLSAIAHQWRQPLNTLSTYILSLQSAYYNGMVNKDFVEKLVTRADSQIQFMSKTIDDFRHFFKPSKNKEEFKLAEAVENAIKLLEPSFRQTGIDISYPSAETFDKVTVYGYQSEFAHVIVNILSNAKDAIISRSAEEPECDKGIIIDFQDGEKSVNITIEDTGKGIPRHVSAKIFDPYFTTKGTASGTGIGLYMAKTIVENEMNGSISASNGKVGAVFTINLPKFGVK